MMNENRSDGQDPDPRFIPTKYGRVPPFWGRFEGIILINCIRQGSATTPMRPCPTPRTINSALLKPINIHIPTTPLPFSCLPLHTQAGSFPHPFQKHKKIKTGLTYRGFIIVLINDSHPFVKFTHQDDVRLFSAFSDVFIRFQVSGKPGDLQNNVLVERIFAINVSIKIKENKRKI